MAKLADMIFDDLMGRGKGIETARQWRTWMRRFEVVCGIKESYAREDVIAFLSSERSRGYCQNTINTHERPVQLLAKLQGWEYPHLDRLKVKDSDVSRPVFEREEIEQMITKGLTVLDSRELACLAVATTYGVRREELCSPNAPEIVDGQIKIWTVKGGVPTTHIIAEEIKEVLKAYRGYSVGELTKMFHRIVKKTEVKIEEGYGWHSIRRGLATELIMEEVSGLNVLRFMRWSESSFSREVGMLRIYAKKDQAKIDREVFKVHPFLPYWSGEKREEAGSKVNGLVKSISVEGLSASQVDLVIKLVENMSGL